MNGSMRTNDSRVVIELLPRTYATALAPSRTRNASFSSTSTRMCNRKERTNPSSRCSGVASGGTPVSIGNCSRRRAMPERTTA